MRDIPLFTTENGVASLALKEIPYTARAYIRIQDSAAPLALVAECADFCRSVGAEHIYATGHTALAEFPLHTDIWQMQRLREGLCETDVALFPVQEQTLEYWRGVYNERMRDVPNAAYMSEADAKALLKKGNGYFVHKDGQLLGIGIASGDTINTVISVSRGAGREVMLALNRALSGDVVKVEVASANTRAVALYKRVGFMKTGCISRWYRVFDM